MLKYPDADTLEKRLQDAHYMQDRASADAWARDLEFLVTNLADELREDCTSDYAQHEAETLNRILVAVSSKSAAFDDAFLQQVARWITLLEDLRFPRRSSKRPGFHVSTF